VREALAEAAAVLRQAGCETPRLDAELLLASALGVERSRLVIDADSVLEVSVRERFEAAVRRRAAREPVAYIVGRREFRHISLLVDRRVLIPRPETELLVEVGLTLPRGCRVADVGTGSGAVALALKDERLDLQICGIDVSADALSLARANAIALGLDVRFVQADLVDAASYDALLANLPYVAAGEELAPEIALYEPAQALYAGEDGLEAIRRLLERVGDASLVALEVGLDQAPEVARLVRRTGYASVEVLRDLAGHDRVVVGRR
jgi:release factor glutamine methyltransferase